MVSSTYLNLLQENSDSNVVIMGDSAGGGLAMILAQFLRDQHLSLPAAMILFSPFLDLSVNGDDQPALEALDPALNIHFLRKAGSMWAKDITLNDPRVSPLFGNHKGLPRTLIFTGTRDILDSDVRRLETQNSEAIIQRYPEMLHVWPVAPNPEGRRALDAAVQFITGAPAFQIPTK